MAEQRTYEREIPFLKIGAFQILRIKRERVIIVDQPPMTEAELNSALAVSAELPLFRAVLQLLRTATDNAHLQAAANIENTNKLASYVGGGEHMASFEAELVRRQQEGTRES